MKNNTTNSFLERVVNFDFDRDYTTKVRIISHVLMWSVATFLMTMVYYLPYKFDLQSSLFLSLRLTLCNIVVFYLLFYLVIPLTLKKNRILFFLITIFLLFQLWLTINHYLYILLYKYTTTENDILEALLKENYTKSILEIISPKNIMSHAFEILNGISPFLFAKVTFDLSRTYAKSIKVNREVEKLQYENVVMENKYLQTQLNPHFLFNTLNNLYGLAIKKDEATPEVILKLSEIMRYTLYDINVEKINVQQELDFLSNYYEMERMRYPKDYAIKMKVINEGDKGLKIAPLLSFVFIENAFKYGLKSDNPFLQFYIEIKEKNIYFVIENDISVSNRDKIGGIGIENAKKRLELLYPQKYSLSINNNENKFTVHLKIDLS